MRYHADYINGSTTGRVIPVGKTEPNPNRYPLANPRASCFESCTWSSLSIRQMPSPRPSVLPPRSCCSP
ncbi:protein of unknown function [Rhodovastum atsumiense]|nr:protein of unknown function [Rhodovastum atsumiense]